MLFLSSTIILVILSLLGNMVLYRSFNQNVRHNSIFRLIGMILMILSSGLPLLLLFLNYHKIITPDSPLFIWSLFTCILLIFPLFFFLFYYLIFILPFSKTKQIKRYSSYIGWVSIGLIFSVILYGALTGRKKITLTHDSIYAAKLPSSFDGFRIAHISDMHLGSFFKDTTFIRSIIQTINKQKPDIICFTGDLVNSRSAEIIPFTKILSELHAPYGVYSVLGNHDYGKYHNWNTEDDKTNNFHQIIELQSIFGWKLLNNEHNYIRKENDSIAIIGVENIGEKRFGQQGDLMKALSNVDQNDFSILLSHNPTHWTTEVIPSTSIDLTLSGHTHAMQTQMGSFSPSSWIYPHWGGIYKDGEQYLNVNKGIGFVLIPIRIGAYPEISIIELRQKQE